MDASSPRTRCRVPEYSGPKAAQRGAFTGRSVVLCDTVRSDKDALTTVEGIFRTLGSPAVYMDPEEVFTTCTRPMSRTSRTSPRSRWRSRCSKRSARSVTSSTWRAAVSRARCAWPRVRRQRGSRSCWRNKYNALDVLREHIHQLQIMRRMLERDDAEGLKNAMERANTIQRIIH